MSAQKKEIEIKAILLDGLNISTELLSLLKTEQTALSENDISTFDNIISTKNELINKLSEKESKLSHYLSLISTDLNNNVNQDSYDSFINNSPSLDKLHSDFNDNIRKCSDVNRKSGLIVQYRIKHTRQALDILRGIDDSTHLYTASGNELNTSQGHLINCI